MEENLSIKGYTSPPTPEDLEDMMIISRTLLWDLTLHYPEGHERRQWAEAKIAEVDAEHRDIHPFLLLIRRRAYDAGRRGGPFHKLRLKGPAVADSLLLGSGDSADDGRASGDAGGAVLWLQL